jgi:hypothetical protein
MARRDPIAPIAAKFGFVEVRHTRHRIWQHPSGAVVTTGSTLSDRRALMNIEKQFRRSLAAV